MNDKELIIRWLDGIIQKATDRKARNTLNEIKVLVKDAKQYINYIKKDEQILKPSFGSLKELKDLIWEFKNSMQ